MGNSEKPRLYYKYCEACDKKDQPFEQRNWSLCIYCGLFIAVSLARQDPSNPDKPKVYEKKIEHILSYKHLEDADKTWREIQNVIHHEFVTANYRGAPNFNNLVNIVLTDKGKKVLGRA